MGFEVTKAAIEAGDKVVATVRSSPAALYASFGNHPNLFVVEMDVTRENDVKNAVKKGIAQFGKLDTILNNTGYGIIGAIEEVSDAEARRQYDTNVFGVLNVLRTTLKGLNCSKNNFWIAIRNPVYCGKIHISKYKDEESRFVQGLHAGIISNYMKTAPWNKSERSSVRCFQKN